MNNSLGSTVSNLLVPFFIFVIFSLIPIAANAQQPPSQPPTTAPAAAADSGLPVDAEAIIKIKSEFATVKLCAYVSVVLASLAGVMVCVYRRKRLTTFSKTSGAVTAAVLSMGLFALFSLMLSSPEGNACASAALEVGNAAKDYDDVCRAARESVANSFGLASAFRSMFISGGSGFIVPIGVGVVKALSYTSVLLASLLAFFMLRPVAEKLFVRI